MQVISVRNVHQALPRGLALLKRIGTRRNSRNGPVLVAPVPVTTCYDRPTERVIFWEQRDANPFFHFMESLWMLGARNDIAFLTPYVKQIAAYSDNGRVLHGAYGYRWMKHFEMDQLEMIAWELRDKPDSRRCVLQIWDATVDLGRTGKDLPCNTQVYFSRNVDGDLDMTLLNRSNDIIWGAYGANAVHFSFLQEFIATWVGCGVGKFWQVSNNFHAYLKTLEPLKGLELLVKTRVDASDPYINGVVSPYPLIRTPNEIWRQDLEMFLDGGMVVGYRDSFFRKVAVPMAKAHEAYRTLEGRERYEIALEILDQVAATDWRLAAKQWILRRLAKFEE